MQQLGIKSILTFQLFKFMQQWVLKVSQRNHFYPWREERLQDSGRHFLLLSGYYKLCEIRNLLMTIGEYKKSQN